MKYVKFLMLALFFVITACSKSENANVEMTSIVIPPGGLIQFSPEKFSYYANREYAVYFREINEKDELKTILEITPSKNERIDTDRIFQTVVPKGTVVDGTYVIEVVMDSYPNVKFTSYVFNEEVTKPSIVSTLVWNAIKSYKNKSLKSYSKQQILDLEAWVTDFMNKQLASFGLSDQMNLNKLYKFLQNGLSNNPEFIAELSKVGATFNYAYVSDPIYGQIYKWVSGDVLYLKENVPPVISNLTTQAGIQPGIENSEVLLQAYATDNEGDLVFYVWKKKNPDETYSIVDKEVNLFSFFPGYDDAGTYYFQVQISDGGLVTTRDWQVVVNNYNRSPEIIGSCPTSVIEGQLWSCTITGKDLDPTDTLKWKIEPPSSVSGEFLVNGGTVFTDLPGSQITITWTPNNKDSKDSPMKRINLLLNDILPPGVGGSPSSYSTSLDIKVIDNNQAPEVLFYDRTAVTTQPSIYSVVSANPTSLGSVSLNSPIVDLNSLYDNIKGQEKELRKWDSVCGYDPDTQDSNLKYKFQINVKDADDNTLIGAGDERDIVSVAFDPPGPTKNHGLKLFNPSTGQYESIVTSSGEYDATNKMTSFKFEIMPTISSDAMLYELKVSDNHGSVVVPVKFGLKIKDRASCVKISRSANNLSVNEGTNPTAGSSFIFESSGTYNDASTISYSTDILFKFGTSTDILKYLPFIGKGSLSTPFIPYRSSVAESFIDKTRYTSALTKNSVGVFASAYTNGQIAGYILLSRPDVGSFNIDLDNRLKTQFNVDLNGQTVPITLYFRIPNRAGSSWTSSCPLGVTTTMANAIANTISNIQAKEIAVPLSSCFFDFIPESCIDIYKTASDTNTYQPNSCSTTQTSTFKQNNFSFISNVFHGATNYGRSNLKIIVNDPTINKIPKGTYFVVTSKKPVGWDFLNLLPETYIYVTTRDFYRDAKTGTFTLDAILSYEKMKVPAPSAGNPNPIVWDIPSGTSYTITNVEFPGFMGGNPFDINTANSSASFTFDALGIGRMKILSSECIEIIEKGAAPKLNLKMNENCNTALVNTNDVYLTSDIVEDSGKLNIKNSTTSDIVLSNADYTIRTPKGIRLLLTNSPVTILAGQNVILNLVRDDTQNTSAPLTSTISFSESNTTGYVLTSAADSISVGEGEAEDGLEIWVTDNGSQKERILDQKENYKITLKNPDASTVIPVSNGDADSTTGFELCRHKKSQVSTCYPCSDFTNAAAGIETDSSRFCYLRYVPTRDDIKYNNQKYSLKLEAEGSRSVPATKPSKVIDIFVKEKNDPSVFARVDGSGNWILYSTTAGALGTTKDNPIDTQADYGGFKFTEGVAGSFKIYATDPDPVTADRTTSYSELGFAIEEFWYTNGGVLTKEATIPTGLTIQNTKCENLGGVNSCTDNVFGARNSADITWTPNDAQVKKYSSAEGIVVKVKNYTKTFLGTAEEKPTSIWFKFKVDNVDNPPVIKTIANASTNSIYDSTKNTFTVYSDSYFKGIITLEDKDGATPLGGTFITSLTMCMSQPEGNYTCNLDPSSNWSVNLTTFDPAYNFNSGIGECRNSDGSLNQDLAKPRLTRIGSGAKLSSGEIQYTYYLEWCPQRMHIGSYSGNLELKDFGDMDRQGVLSTTSPGLSALKLNVVSKPFFVSPKYNMSLQPIHYPRQVAGNMPSNPFKYPVIVNNSLGGTLSYSLVQGPVGLSIDQNTGLISWSPSASDIGTTPTIKIKVTDITNNFSDNVHFPLVVQNPNALNNVERPPVVNSGSVTPSAYSQSMYEDSTLTFDFAITPGSDNSDDLLFYRWYVDGKLVEDKDIANGEASAFIYIPDRQAGSVDVDGYAGPLQIGEHLIRGVATDGNYEVYQEWKVKVKNNFIESEKIFDLKSARKESSPTPDVGKPGSLAINQDILIPWIYTSGGTSYVYDHLALANSYTSTGSTVRRNLWDIVFLAGELRTNFFGSNKWSFNESANWTTEAQRLSYKTTAFGINVYLTPLSGRFPSFTDTTNSLTFSFNTDLKDQSLTACSSSSCSDNFFKATGVGTTLAKFIKVGTVDLVVHYNPSERILKYDKGTSGTVTSLLNLSVGNQKITGFDYSASEERLYVLIAESGGAPKTFIRIYDMSPVKSNLTATLVADKIIKSATNTDGDFLASDLVIVPQALGVKVVGLLRGYGSGGALAVYESSADTLGIISNGINSSPSDTGGVKLAYDSYNNTVVGLLRDANQVIVYDPVTSNLYKSATLSFCDSILVSPSGLILLVDRTNGIVYKGK